MVGYYLNGLMEPVLWGAWDELEPDVRDWAVLRLAVAVAEQAVRDLVGPVDKACRDDAYDFLANRLWDEECSWYDVLGQYLSRSQVVRRVHKVLREQKRPSRRIR